MAKRMLIDAQHPEETRVVIADENQVYDFDFVSAARKQLKGNIYLAKITRVEPSLQAAFVEYGGNKQGFLPFSEIHPDYYQIPTADRRRLMEEAEQEAPEAPEPARTEAEAAAPADSAAAEETSFPATAPETENPEATAQPAEGDSEHPAYLMQGAIDVSISEEVEPEEGEQHAIEAPAAEHSEQTAAEAATEEAKPEATPAEEVETLPNEEEEVRNRPKRNFFKRYKIQEVIRRGQIVLVQVIKEERGNKGCSLTTYLSLPGRYCVLMPNSPKDGGVSRKIASTDDRKRLKAIYQELKLAAGMSVIIRTAGMDRTRAEIKRDYDYLVKLWNQIREDTLASTAPALIYEESDIIKRSIRDPYSNDIEEVIVEGDSGYKASKEFMKLLLPSHTPKVKHYKEATPLFYAYNIEDQLLSMHDPVVKLRSGGYIVINPTEALISIDVNSGRSTGERNIEETATKTNLEAAAEVARQLRLRDLAGLIVIDFIDMMESRNRRNVERALRDALKADRAKLQLGRISPFGLLEMSRQRLRPSITESNMVQCPHCIGRGVIRSNESMNIQMIRAIEKEASTGTWGSFRLIAPQAVSLHLLNHKRDILRAIEQRYEVTVQVLIGPDLTASEFNLEKMRRAQSERNASREPQRERQERRPQPQGEEITGATEEAVNDNAGPSETSREEGYGKGRRRGRRGGRGRDRYDRPDRQERQDRQPAMTDHTEAEQAVESSLMETADVGEQPSERSPRQRRERGGRGRRKWRDRDQRSERREGEPQAAQPREWQEPSRSDSVMLPAFATEKAVPVPAHVPEPAAAAAPLPSTPRDPNAPPKRGWWQKMIQLDS
ncbi:MAG: ribonuclease E/G [Pseudomonadota bacterium]|nr:ribonuclease E/G [Pseudomonadota bacterium]